MSKEPMPGKSEKPIFLESTTWAGKRRRYKFGKSWMWCGKPRVTETQANEKPISRSDGLKS